MISNKYFTYLSIIFFIHLCRFAAISLNNISALVKLSHLKILHSEDPHVCLFKNLVIIAIMDEVKLITTTCIYFICYIYIRICFTLYSEYAEVYFTILLYLFVSCYYCVEKKNTANIFKTLFEALVFLTATLLICHVTHS